MKRLGGAAAAIAAVAVATPFVTAGGAQQAGERTLTLVEKAGVDFFVDNPPASKPRHVTPGDLAVVRVPLFDEAGVRQGTGHLSCVTTRGGLIDEAQFQCSGTFKLKDGMLAFSVLFVGQSDERVAVVTGGTGAYEGARGSDTSRFGPDGNRIHSVHLLA